MDFITQFRLRLNPNGRSPVKGHRLMLADADIYGGLSDVLEGKCGESFRELSLRRLRATKFRVQDNVWAALAKQILADYIQFRDEVIVRSRAERVAESLVDEQMIAWLRDNHSRLTQREAA